MTSPKWIRELAAAYRKPEDLPAGFSLAQSELAFFNRFRTAPGGGDGTSSSETSPAGMCIPSSYFSLCTGDPEDPIRRQCIPRVEEFILEPYEGDDPLEEKSFSPLPRLVHRYRDRCLFLTTDHCAMYCRHCFRRHFTGMNRGPASEEEIDEAAAYLSRHGEIRELILSGGDPLTLDDDSLERMLETFRRRNPELMFRLASRMPAVLPSRITDDLCRLLRKYSPLFLITQFNHPRELTGESRTALAMLIDRGIPVFNQTVLLRKVNDNDGVLADLFHRLLSCRVKPYYLFQGDLAAGTAHHRVPLAEGISLDSRLRNTVSGLALPVYAVDLPGGGGKIRLHEKSILRFDGTWYYLEGTEGTLYRYPAEHRKE